MAPPCVTDTSRPLSCRDSKAAARLKLISIFVIFFTSLMGVSSPVALARWFHGRPAYDRAILVIKCFAAGVIISTSLVHVLPDAFDALSDCQLASRHPWRDYPFPGLVTLIGVLAALLVDMTATSRAHGSPSGKVARDYARIGAIEEPETTIGKRLGEEEEDELVRMKQKLVSRVLEIGIIFHSVIIGATMGMSQNPCTIPPLVAAIAFHQIFEGLGLGSCLAQADFSLGTRAYMSFMFSVTTPMGILLGMIIFAVTGYDDTSANALVLEGLLGSLSSGVLMYIALVDLVALDFFHNKLMSSEAFMKNVSFAALVLGSTSMSILALWA